MTDLTAEERDESTEIMRLAYIHKRDVIAADLETEKGRKRVEQYRNQEYDDFNSRYAMTLVEGKSTILYRQQDEDIPGRPIGTQYGTDGSLRSFLANKKLPFVRQDAEGRHHLEWVPILRVWLESDDRRQYPKVKFRPRNDIVATTELPNEAGPYNLFCGVLWEPTPGDCRLIKEHIWTVWCRGQQPLYDYIISWLARMVQKPDELAGSVPVLRGPEGAGKNIVTNIFTHWWCGHGLELTKTDDPSKFNDHLATCVFLVLNEALWGGNHSGQGTLKALITDKTMVVERKYIPKFRIANYSHIMALSNEAWSVPVGLGDRRFAMFDVSNEHVGDRAYFNALSAEIAAGGDKAFVHHLLHDIDIAGFDPEAIPVEAAGESKVDHQIRGADTPTKWLVDCVEQGCFVHKGRVHEWEEECLVDSQWLYQCFREQEGNARVPTTASVFGRRLSKLLEYSCFEKGRRKNSARHIPPWPRHKLGYEGEPPADRAAREASNARLAEDAAKRSRMYRMPNPHEAARALARQFYRKEQPKEFLGRDLSVDGDF